MAPHACPTCLGTVCSDSMAVPVCWLLWQVRGRGEGQEHQRRWGGALTPSDMHEPGPICGEWKFTESIPGPKWEHLVHSAAKQREKFSAQRNKHINLCVSTHASISSLLVVEAGPGRWQGKGPRSGLEGRSLGQEEGRKGEYQDPHPHPPHTYGLSQVGAGH